MSGAAPGGKPGRRGKLAVLLVVGLGALAAVVKIVLEHRVEPEVRSQIAALRKEIASYPPEDLLRDEHRRLREIISGSKITRTLDFYRDRSIPLLEEAYRQDRRPGGEALRAAWLLVLLKLDSPRSRSFLEEVAPDLTGPDLRRDVERYLARQTGRR